MTEFIEFLDRDRSGGGTSEVHKTLRSRCCGQDVVSALRNAIVPARPGCSAARGRSPVFAAIRQSAAERLTAARDQVSGTFMPQKVRIALDAMGGDIGASVVIPGAAISLSRHPDTEFLL